MKLKRVRRFLRRHKVLLRVVKFIIRYRPVFVYTWEDVGLMVDEWCSELPNDFDCIIGIPRSGLLVADRIALNKGCALSVPDCFLNGDVWFSRTRVPERMIKVLVVEDSVTNGKQLFSGWFVSYRFWFFRCKYLWNY